MYFCEHSEYSILLLGLDNAGKTTFLNQVKAMYSASGAGSSSLSSSSSSSSSAATALASSLFQILGGGSSSGTASSRGRSSAGASGGDSAGAGDDDDGRALLSMTSAAARNATPAVGQTVPTVGQNVATISLPGLYLKLWDVGGQHSLRQLWQSYYASCHAIVFIIDSTDVGDGDITRLSQSYHPAPPPPPSGAAADGAAFGEGGEEEGEGEEESRLANDEHHTQDGNQHNSNNQVHQEQQQQQATLDRGRLDECRLVLEDVLQHSDAEGVPLLVLANKQDREDCIEVVRIKEGLVRRVFEGERAGRGVRDSRVLPVSALTGLGVAEAVDWLCSRVKWNKDNRPPVMR